jgi:hypothetical protein
VILSDRCGARDRLVRTGVNGFVIESDNPSGMAYFMNLLGEDEALWRRMALAAQESAAWGDTARFVEGVSSLIRGVDSAKRSPRGLGAVSTGADILDPSGRAPVEADSILPSRPIWPNFFLVGAPKAGTTAIATALMKHPDVFPSAVKEPNYFNSDIQIESFFAPLKFRNGRPTRTYSYAVIRDQQTYLQLFSGAEKYKAVGDCSSHYLRSRVAAEAIRAAVPEAKIIISLRNPVDRAYSHYLMDLKVGKVSRPFSEVIMDHVNSLGDHKVILDNYIESSLYYEKVNRYISTFGRDNVLIVFQEDLTENFDGVISKIFSHIAVDNIGVGKILENQAVVAKVSALNRWLYKSGMKRAIVRYSPEFLKALGIRYYYRPPGDMRLPDRDRLWLTEFFRKDIDQLSVLLGRDLSHWTMPVAATTSPEKV